MRLLTSAREHQYRAKRKHDLLSLTHDRFHDAFDGIALGATVVTLQGRILDTNPALESILRSTADELRGRSVTELTHPDDRPAARKLFWQLLAGERDHYRLEKRYLRGDGSVGQGVVTVALVRDLDGHPRHLLGLLDDLSRQRLPPSPRPRRQARAASKLEL